MIIKQKMIYLTQVIEQTDKLTLGKKHGQINTRETRDVKKYCSIDEELITQPITYYIKIN